MADKVMPGPVERPRPTGSINIQTEKILDACRDKDCIDDLRVYPTVSSQTVIDSAFSVRPDSATLIYADVKVDAISFNRGYYTVDVTYFYIVNGQTFPDGTPVRGLAVFDKRVILYGSEGSVKRFSTQSDMKTDIVTAPDGPLAVVDAVDPIALNLRIGEPGTGEERELRSIPQEIIDAIGEELNLAETGKRLYVTLGQFSMIRLERSVPFTISAENYLPSNECAGSSSDDPCTMFSRVRFPVDEFFPPETVPTQEQYRDLI